ncbi:MAG: hypothetical protein ACE361_07045 [Aureliella sp.]
MSRKNSKTKPLKTNEPQVLLGVLVFLSGMAALGHQLLWTRRLIDLLGASTESSARVFGTFFLGLSVGSAIAALLVGRVRNPLRMAALVQLSIPFLVAPVIYLPELTDWIWPAIGAESVQSWNGSAIKSLLTLGFVFPPSTMMGLSFPLIVAGVLRVGRGELGRSGINLYAINTLGGASGVLFTVMVAVPQLGNFASMVLAAAVDGSIGLILLVLARRTNPSEPIALKQDIQSQEKAAATPDAFYEAIGLAFFSGMAVLALEVTAFQMLQLVATISLFSPAAVLFCVILSLGTSAALFSRFQSFFTAHAKTRTIALILGATGILVVLAPQIFMTIAQQSNWFAQNKGASDFVVKLGALALLSVGPAWLIGGLIFPYAIARSGEHCTTTQAGQRLGLLLAINGLGGLLGAELAYRALLPTFGVYGAMTFIGLSFAAIAITYSLRTNQGSNAPVSRFSGVAAAAIVLIVGLLNSNLPIVNPPPGVKALDIQSGRHGTVAVVEDERGDRSILVSNQYMLGGSAVRYDQERQVLLPAVLHENPISVGCIGLATGITPGAALTVDSVKDVTAIEISPMVATAAKTYFSDFNHNICDDESASVVVADGRTYIASLSDKFDVITGDLFLPWAPGTARLYSIEHFAAVRRALKSDGIFCQWLPMYQLTPEQFRLIADTFASEFGTTQLFMNHFRVGSPMLALVGRNGTWEIDWEWIAERCNELRESNTVGDPVLRHKAGIELLYLGEWRQQSPDTQLVSLIDPSLEYSAATVRLSPDPGKKYFNAANWVRFCRSRGEAHSNENTSSANQVKLMTVATGLLEVDYAIRTKNKRAEAIAQRVASALPPSIISDGQADWRRWPSSLAKTSPSKQPKTN